MKIGYFVLAILVFLIISTVAVSASQAIVANQGDDTLSIIDTSKKEPFVINVGDGPTGIALIQNKTKALITNKFEDNVTLLNLINMEIEKKIPVRDEPTFITTDQDNAYVVNSQLGLVSIINLNTFERTDISVGDRPIGIAILTTKRKAYVSNYMSKSISVIDLNTSSVIENLKDIKNLRRPGAIVASHDEEFVYVLDIGRDALVKIDTETKIMTPMVSGLNNIKDYHNLFVDSNYALIPTKTHSGGEVHMVELDFGVVTTLTLDSGARQLDFKNGVIYVSNGEDTLTMINTETNIQKDFKAGKDPYGVKILSETYVSIQDEESEEVGVIEDIVTKKISVKRIVGILIIILILTLFALRKKKKRRKS